jgi:hypothetical protein
MSPLPRSGRPRTARMVIPSVPPRRLRFETVLLDVGGVEGGSGPGFATETFQCLGVSRNTIGQELAANPVLTLTTSNVRYIIEKSSTLHSEFPPLRIRQNYRRFDLPFWNGPITP